MFRPATRLIASNAARAVPRAAAPTRRFISTAPPANKSRSWKSLFARIGAAGGIIYYYNTADVWAEEPRPGVVAALPIADTETEQLPTIDDVSAARLKRKAEREAIEAQLSAQRQAEQQKQAAADANETLATVGSVEEMEEEAGQQGAFNPETGEINWDCPCLGGMADGPCGEEFKAAFSCFVYSTEEPKGMDCIEKFKDMQGCFRQHPDVYGSELESDADDEEDDFSAEGVPADAQSTSGPLSATSSAKEDAGLVPDDYRPSGATDRANKAAAQVKRDHEPTSESEELVPKAAHDATDANVQKK